MENILPTNLTEVYITNKAMETHVGGFSIMRQTKGKKVAQGLRHLDPETDYKVRSITSQVSESVKLGANEPSLGFFRIQEHVHRTMPQLVKRKQELKANAQKIEEATYDLGLSVNVIENVSSISHFTRIKEALRTTIELKKKLNLLEDQKRHKEEEASRKAREANKSLSLNERAEGYICPVCYFALKSQDELISHWQAEHSLKDCENDVFQEVDIPTTDDFVLNNVNDMTIIDMRKKYRHLSECEDVVASFHEPGGRFFETGESSASSGSGDIKDGALEHSKTEETSTAEKEDENNHSTSPPTVNNEQVEIDELIASEK